MDGALKPQENLLGCQQSWTSYFFSPRTAFCPPQEPLVASFSSAQDWALAQDQQEAEEGEEEGSLGA